MAKELDKKGRVSYGTVVRELMRSIGDYRAVTIATPLLVLVEVACEMAIPFLTAGLIDQIKVGATVAELLQPAAVLVLLALLSLAFGTGAGITCSHASCGFAKNLRRDMFYNIQRFSFANIDEFSSSSLVTRLTTDINNVQQAFMMIVRIAVRTPLCLVFAFTMAAVMGGALALVYAAIIPVLGFVLFYIIHLVRPIFTRVFHKYDALNESIEENVTGMRVVKSYVREDYEKSKFAHAAQDICVDFTRAEKLLAFNNPAMMFAVDLTWVVIIYFGSQVIITSHGTLFDVGQLSAIFTYGFQILMSLMQLSMIFVMVTMADESARRISEVLDAEPTIDAPEQAVTEVADGSIDFDHVSFKYSARAERQALADVDLHVRSGETIGIIGGTGSSKSTLVNLVARLYDATEGRVRVGGVDVRDYDLEALRTNVAMVLQKNVLFSGTIAENLRWGDENATDDEVREAAPACADEFVDENFPRNYDTYIEQGRLQRLRRAEAALCIARALLRHRRSSSSTTPRAPWTPRPTPRSAPACIITFPRPRRSSSPSASPSVQDADRIVVMEGHYISDVGTHDELMRRSAIYRETYTSQEQDGHRRATSRPRSRTGRKRQPQRNAGAEKGGEADE